MIHQATPFFLMEINAYHLVLPTALLVADVPLE